MAMTNENELLKFNADQHLKVTTTSFDQSLSCVHWMDVKQPHKGTFTNLLTVYSMFVVVGGGGYRYLLLTIQIFIIAFTVGK